MKKNSSRQGRNERKAEIEKEIKLAEAFHKFLRVLRVRQKLFLKPVHNSLDSVLKMRFTEINQKSKFASAQSQLRQHLFGMNPGQDLNRFQFHDDFALDQEISSKAFFKNKFIVMDRNRNLSFRFYARLTQFVRENNFVNRFKKSGTSPGVNLERCIKNNFSKLILIHRPQVSARETLFLNCFLRVLALFA